jgi:hypothetical protein
MIVQDYLRHTEQVIGDRGVTLIRAYLPTQYMYLGHHGGTPKHNPVPGNAGMLAASIATERQVPDAVAIRGDLVTYGAWIEGVDPMNLIPWKGRIRRGLSPRFPGYHTFRIISDVLDKAAEDIMVEELPPFLRELNS